jgi:hypothetical protein
MLAVFLEMEVTLLDRPLQILVEISTSLTTPLPKFG